MTEETDLAPQEAGGEAVQTEEVEQTTEAAEAPKSTEGNPATEEPAKEEVEAKADAEAEEERKSRNQRRREAKQKMQADLAKAQEDAEAAQAALEKFKKAASSLKRPVEKDFATYDEYQTALATHGSLQAMDQRRIAELEEAAKDHFGQVEAKKEAQRNADKEAMSAHFADGQAKYPDFLEVATVKAPINAQESVALLAQSENAADVIYTVGTDPEIGKAFAEMEGQKDWLGVARLIGRLEAQATAPKPKTTTDAPEPITPVKPKATAGKRWEDMSPEEFDKFRAAGGVPR